MWFAGQEGGTSTARILLGQANPSGHTVLTWPANRTDTIWGYNEPANALYPGSTAGQHLERLNSNAGCAGTGNPGSLACPAAGGTNESEGIFTGYRYFDKLGITPRVPVRLRPLVHDLRVLEAEGRQGEGRRPRRQASRSRTPAPSPAPTRSRSTSGRRATQPAGVQFAVRSLAQFDRVELAPGQSKEVKLHVNRRGALVLVRREAAVGARRRRPHALRRRRRRRRPTCRCRRRSSSRRTGT